MEINWDIISTYGLIGLFAGFLLIALFRSLIISVSRDKKIFNGPMIIRAKLNDLVAGDNNSIYINYSIVIIFTVGSKYANRFNIDRKVVKTFDNLVYKIELDGEFQDGKQTFETARGLDYVIMDSMRESLMEGKFDVNRHLLDKAVVVNLIRDIINHKNFPIDSAPKWAIKLNLVSQLHMRIAGIGFRYDSVIEEAKSEVRKLRIELSEDRELLGGLKSQLDKRNYDIIRFEEIIRDSKKYKDRHVPELEENLSKDIHDVTTLDLKTAVKERDLVKSKIDKLSKDISEKNDRLILLEYNVYKMAKAKKKAVSKLREEHYKKIEELENGEKDYDIRGQQ